MAGTYRKRPPFHYFEMGFKVGDKLFFKDDRSITAEILTDGTDAFDGEEEYLTPLTERLRGVYSSTTGKYWVNEAGKMVFDIYEETYPLEEYR